MTNVELADKMDAKLREASDTVHAKAAGSASLKHTRLSPLEFKIELGMLGGNFMFDAIMKRQLKSTLKQIDPGAEIMKIG
jgi:hypothetical protein